MKRKKLIRTSLMLICVATFAGVVGATMMYPLVVFNAAGDDPLVPRLNVFVEVADAGPGLVDFSFHNESMVESSVARIYFDDDAELLLALADMDGFGALFSQKDAPPNLPGGRSLSPEFEASEDFTFAALAPPPKNGLNPGDWTKMTFNLVAGFDAADVREAMDTGRLRIGAHIIALPDGSSMSAVSVPEPTTLVLFGYSIVSIIGTAGSVKYLEKRCINTKSTEENK